MLATFSRQFVKKKQKKEGNVTDKLETDCQEFMAWLYTQLNTLYKMEKKAETFLSNYKTRLDELRLVYNLIEQTMACPSDPLSSKMTQIQALAENARKTFNTSPSASDDNATLMELFQQGWEGFTSAVDQQTTDENRDTVSNNSEV